jgi:hypothetical protein
VASRVCSRPCNQRDFGQARLAMRSASAPSLVRLARGVGNLTIPLHQLPFYSSLFVPSACAKFLSIHPTSAPPNGRRRSPAWRKDPLSLVCGGGAIWEGGGAFVR